MKRVYMVRHAKAEDYDPDRHESDADRALTSDGADEFERVARAVRRLDKKIEIVLTSPLRRAKETAGILAKALGVGVEVFDELDPPVSPQRLLAAVKKRAEERLALVGHEPGCGEVIARWIGLGRSLPLKKGGVARLELDEPDSKAPADLAWLATPEILGSAEADR